jgi:hypothetical protein
MFIFSFTLRNTTSTLFVSIICKWISIFFFETEMKARTALKIQFSEMLRCFGFIPKTWL